jgi:predicted component of type VI protein secretion system
MRGTWEAYKSGNKNTKRINSDQKNKSEEKTAYNAELKELIRGHVKELLNTEKRSGENDGFNIKEFNNIQLSDEDGKHSE